MKAGEDTYFMEGTLAPRRAKVEGVRWVSPEENDGGVKRGISRDGHSGVK